MVPYNGTTTTGIHVHRKAITHMTFFWGHKTQVLFKGWPGSSTGMYALALISVFTLAVIVEWFSYCSIIKQGANNFAAGFFQTGMHAVRSGRSYLVMLAVISFNGGIFLGAVSGQAVGFALFARKVFNKSEKIPDLPPINIKC